MYIHNPYGEDMAEIQEKNGGIRVGRRIREIREDHDPVMSQGDLGAAVGLTSNRIQQYENGARKPKIALLKQIAAALGVETASKGRTVLSKGRILIGISYFLDHEARLRAFMKICTKEI